MYNAASVNLTMITTQ